MSGAHENGGVYFNCGTYCIDASDGVHNFFYHLKRKYSSGYYLKNAELRSSVTLRRSRLRRSRSIKYAIDLVTDLDWEIGVHEGIHDSIYFPISPHYYKLSQLPLSYSFVTMFFKSDGYRITIPRQANMGIKLLFLASEYMLLSTPKVMVRYSLYEYILKVGLLSKSKRASYDALHKNLRRTILLCDNTIYDGSKRSSVLKTKEYKKGIAYSMVDEFRQLTRKNFHRIIYLYRLRRDLMHPNLKETDDSWLKHTLDLSLHVLNINVYVLIKCAAEVAVAACANSVDIDLSRFGNYLFSAITGEKPLRSTFSIEFQKFLKQSNYDADVRYRMKDFKIDFLDKHSKLPIYARSLIDGYVDKISRTLENYESDRLNMIISLYYMTDGGSRIPTEFKALKNDLLIDVEEEDIVSSFLIVHQTNEVCRDVTVDFFLERLSSHDTKKFLIGWLDFLSNFQLSFGSNTIEAFEKFKATFRLAWNNLYHGGRDHCSSSAKIVGYMLSVTPSFFRRLFALLRNPKKPGS